MGSQRVGHDWVTFTDEHMRVRVYSKCLLVPQTMASLVAQLVKNLPAMWDAAAARSLQSCPILCDPRDCSPPGSPVPGILQARTLEWVAISFSSAWKWKVKVKSLSRVQLLVTPWTTAYQTPPSMGFPAIWNTWVQFLGWEDPLGKGMASHSNILAWRNPWTEESGSLQSMRSQKVRYDWVTSTFTFIFSPTKGVKLTHIRSWLNGWSLGPQIAMSAIGLSLWFPFYWHIGGSMENL